MSVTERMKKRQQQQQESAPPAAVPLSTAETIRQATKENTDAYKAEAIRPENVTLRPKEELKSGVDWRSLGYDEAAKMNPELTRSSYLSGVSSYRKENNLEPLSYAEMYSTLGGKSPFITAAEEKKRDKDLKTAGYINSIGSVLANLVNYVRTRQGAPAMNLTGMDKTGQARIDAMRNYYRALDRSDYTAYLTMLKQQMADKAARDLAEQKYNQQLHLELAKQNSPLTRLMMGKYREQLLNESAKREGIKADTQYKRLRAEAQEQENRSAPALDKAKLEYLNAKTEYERNRNTEGSGRSKKKPYYVRLKDGKGAYSVDKYNINDDKDVLKMYSEGVKLGLFPEYTEEIVDSSGKTTKRLDLSKMSANKLRDYILYSDYFTSQDDEDFDTVKSYGGSGKGSSSAPWIKSEDNKNNAPWL